MSCIEREITFVNSTLVEFPYSYSNNCDILHLLSFLLFKKKKKRQLYYLNNS